MFEDKVTVTISRVRLRREVKRCTKGV